MRKFRRWLPLSLPAAVICAVAVSASGLAPAAAATGPVSPVPATATPALASTGHTEQVRQLVQCRGTMFAVGSFTKITQGGTPVSRNNVFSFRATAPYKVTLWNPNVKGTVNSIALNTTCTHAYIGGSFPPGGGPPRRKHTRHRTST